MTHNQCEVSIVKHYHPFKFLYPLILFFSISSGAAAMDACLSILCLNSQGATQPQCNQPRNDFFSIKLVTTPKTVAARLAYLMTCQPSQGSGGNHLALIPLIMSRYGTLETDPKN